MSAINQRQPDLRRDAQILLFRHGEEAGAIALDRAQSLREAGDQEGQIYWLRVRDLVGGMMITFRRPLSTARH
ncbi:MAG: hypothetical protein ACPGNT_10065 [Rhodospirillales bacterium]